VPTDWSSAESKELLARHLGGRLRDARSQTGETLADAATAAGITLAHLSDCERGRRLPSVTVLVALTDRYGILLTDLLDGVYPFGSANPPAGVPRPPADGRGHRA
jgi:transcriptional regulator with XRE-family HTH domain